MSQNKMPVSQITRLLTIPEFAKMTGLAYWLARNLVLDGRIPSIDVGSPLRSLKRVDERFVKEWLAKGGYRDNNPSPLCDKCPHCGTLLPAPPKEAK
jgi:hypothetical protein